MAQDFTVVLRGYDRGQVDAVLGAAFETISDGGGPAKRAAARDALRAAAFDVTAAGR
jgi:DivIVA domain-containing protein